MNYLYMSMHIELAGLLFAHNVSCVFSTSSGCFTDIYFRWKIRDRTTVSAMPLRINDWSTDCCTSSLFLHYRALNSDYNMIYNIDFFSF